MRTAWLWLVAALGLHVVDEASTGFLDVYNPTVEAWRASLGWFPMPTFRYDVWLGGLVALVVALALMTPVVVRGPRVARGAAVLFAGLMVMNGIGHVTATALGRTAAAVQFEGPMPGFWSSPILIAAAVYFIVCVYGRQADATDRP